MDKRQPCLVIAVSTLVMLAASGAKLSAQDTIEAIGSALSSGDARTRRAACETLTAMAVRGNARDNPQARSDWQERQPLAAGLIPRLLVVLEGDADERVREAAVPAIVMTSLPANTSVPTVIDRGIEARLVRDFGRDDSWRVRSAIVGALGANGPSDDINKLLLTALGDPAPAVVQIAARHVGRVQATEAVPVLRRLIDHPSPQVRTAVVQALAALGGAARSAVSDLQRRAGVETDDVTARTIRGALTAISRAN